MGWRGTRSRDAGGLGGWCCRGLGLRGSSGQAAGGVPSERVNWPRYFLPSRRLLPGAPAVFLQVSTPTSVRGAPFPPWQSASWRNTPSRATEKPWRCPGRGLSASSPRTPTTPPRRPARPKKWKIPMVKPGFDAGVRRWGGGRTGVNSQAFFLEENRIWKPDGSGEGRTVKRLEQDRRWRWRAKWTWWASVWFRVDTRLRG